MKLKLTSIRISLLISALFLLSSCMMTSPIHSLSNHNHSGIQARTYTNTDMVCGNQNIIHNANLSYQYESEMYYFDSSECLNEFKQNPNLYIDNYTKKRSSNGLLIGMGATITMALIMGFMIL